MGFTIHAEIVVGVRLSELKDDESDKIKELPDSATTYVHEGSPDYHTIIGFSIASTSAWEAEEVSLEGYADAINYYEQQLMDLGLKPKTFLMPVMW